MADTVEGVVEKAARERSPSFPFISLRVAISRLIAFEQTFGRHPVPLEKVGLAWKMKEASSQANQTMAAMKSFGLIDYKSRTAVMTEDGRNYLRAQQESIRSEIVKRCALKPKVIHTFWQLWGADRPIDVICIDDLVLKNKFTESAASTFLRVYDETVLFENLGVDDQIEEEIDDEGEEFLSESTPKLLVDSEPMPPAAVPRTAPTNVVAAQRNVAVPVTLPQGLKQENCILTYGSALLQWPEQMSPEDYEDFNDWVELVLRKIKRSLIKPD